MNRYLVISVLLPVIVFSLHTYAQDHPDSIYGLDPVLYNGKLYTSRLPANIKGHPYLASPDFKTGYVIIKDQKFDNILLNYDIYNQELLLNYQDIAGSTRIILISKSWLNGFGLPDKKFGFIPGNDGQKRIFQVIGNDTLKVLFYWEKELSLSRQTGNTDYYFSDPVKIMYLCGNTGLYRFRNNRNFSDYFSPDKKNKIASYIRENRINVRKAPDTIMLLLVSYCNNIKN
jgi:hypothetical protein